MMTTVKQILEAKGSTFHAVRPTDSVFDAVADGAVRHRLRAGHRQRQAGRDLHRARLCPPVVPAGLVSRDVKVGDLMTPNPYTVGLTGTADDVMATMTAKRFRHIPVVEEGKVPRHRTIGDMVKSIVPAREDHQAARELTSPATRRGSELRGDIAAEADAGADGSRVRRRRSGCTRAREGASAARKRSSRLRRSHRTALGSSSREERRKSRLLWSSVRAAPRYRMQLRRRAYETLPARRAALWGATSRDCCGRVAPARPLGARIATGVAPTKPDGSSSRVAGERRKSRLLWSSARRRAPGARIAPGVAPTKPPRKRRVALGSDADAIAVVDITARPPGARIITGRSTKPPRLSSARGATQVATSEAELARPLAHGIDDRRRPLRTPRFVGRDAWLTPHRADDLGHVRRQPRRGEHAFERADAGLQRRNDASSPRGHAWRRPRVAGVERDHRSGPEGGPPPSAWNSPGLAREEGAQQGDLVRVRQAEGRVAGAARARAQRRRLGVVCPAPGARLQGEPLVEHQGVVAMAVVEGLQRGGARRARALHQRGERRSARSCWVAAAKRASARASPSAMPAAAR